MTPTRFMYRGKHVAQSSDPDQEGTGGAPKPQPQPPAQPGNDPLPDLPDPTEVGEDG